MTTIKSINPADLVPMDIFEEREPLKIDLVYQKPDHDRNIFDTKLYKDSARLWLHKDLAAVVILASRILLWHVSKNNGDIWHLELKDGLRTADAQAAMQETEIVKANPHWMVDGPKRMLAPPGGGAHPRGMAIDIVPITRDGQRVDMGTGFDEMVDQSARSEKNLPPHILQNRSLFEKFMTEAAILCEQDLLPYPAEWWDFRFKHDFYSVYAPLHDKDLPPQMQMTNNEQNDIPDFPDSHFEKLAEDIYHLINQHNDYL